jgi:O-antigen ligase
MTLTAARSTSTLTLVLTAAGAGVVAAKFPLGVQIALLTVAAGAGALLMLKSPAVVPAAFWVGYSLKGTILGGVEVEGVFYPLYGMMLVNSILFLCTRAANPFRNASVRQSAILITAFLAITASAFANSDNGVDDFPFASYQRMFVYCMGLIGAIQFWIDPNRRRFLAAIEIVSVCLSVWVVASALQSGFGYRGRTGVNENYVAEIVAVGLLPVMAALITKDRQRIGSRVLMILILLTGVYALLLLASRGMFIAFAAAMAFAIAHRVRRPSAFLVAAIAVLLGVVILSQLPGSDAIVARFNANDVYTFNDRTAIWSAVWGAAREDSFSQLVFGHGFGSAATLVRNHFAMYTSVHNSYLQIFFEFGGLGLLVFLSCHLVPFFRLVQRADQTSAASAAMLVFLMGSALTGTESDNFQYWLVLAFAAAVSCTPAVAGGERSALFAIYPAKHSIA